MRIQSPSLPELHAFLAVCRLGSFRRAAEALCVTQAAVSRAVLRLEQRLQCTLLDRSSAPVQPTVKGKAFQALVQAHVAGLEQAMDRFGGGAAPRKLRLSVVPTLCTRWLVPRLARFHAAHPQIEVVLQPFRHDDDFSRDDVDLWIRVRRSARPWPRGLRTRYLAGREMLPACAPAVAARLHAPADLLALPLLHHTSYPDNWALWLREAGGILQPPTLGQGFDLGNNLAVAACAGMGAILIQPMLIEQELASGQLVLPFHQAVDSGRGYHVCQRAALDGHAAIESFTSWLMAEASASAQKWGGSPAPRRSGTRAVAALTPPPRA